MLLLSNFTRGGTYREMARWIQDLLDFETMTRRAAWQCLGLRFQLAPSPLTRLRYSSSCAFFLFL